MPSTVGQGGGWVTSQAGWRGAVWDFFALLRTGHDVTRIISGVFHFVFGPWWTSGIETPWKAKPWTERHYYILFDFFIVPPFWLLPLTNAGFRMVGAWPSSNCPGNWLSGYLAFSFSSLLNASGNVRWTLCGFDCWKIRKGYISVLKTAHTTTSGARATFRWHLSPLAHQPPDLWVNSKEHSNTLAITDDCEVC